jgi:RHS repeat-associated protein
VNSSATAYDYDPYGVRAITTDSGGNGTTQNPYTFKAGIQDRVTGWVKFGARWYDPTMGRYPAGHPGRATRPEERQPLRLRGKRPHQQQRPNGKPDV